MNHFLFSELAAKLPVKPDFRLARDIDEIDLPFRNMKFVKKDINNLFISIFSEFMQDYNEMMKGYQNIEVLENSSMSIIVDFGGIHELNVKKVKKDCQKPIFRPSLVFDDSILTNEFMDELDRIHILLSVVFGASILKTIRHIEKEGMSGTLQTKVIYDEVLEFWTKYTKSDFCYFDPLNLDSMIEVEEKEIELGILRFFHTAFFNAFIDLSVFEGEQLKVVEEIIKDTRNYKWYAVFGFWLVKKLDENHVNTVDIIYSDYKKVSETLDVLLNQL